MSKTTLYVIGVVILVCVFGGMQYYLDNQSKVPHTDESIGESEVVEAVKNEKEITENTAIEEKNIDDNSELDVDKTSFAYACADDGHGCNAGRLNEVLLARAEVNPHFAAYINQETNISFEYPSSITEIRYQGIEDNEEHEEYIFINPIIPLPVRTEFWGGMSISVNACEELCKTDLKELITDYLYEGFAERVVVLDDISNFAGRTWIKAHASYPIGSESTVFVTRDNERLIIISSDIIGIHPADSPVVSAFQHILDTLKI